MRKNYYSAGSLDNLAFVVIFAKYQDKWVYAWHKKRQSWEHPGGHVEAGETAQKAAWRELYEETGITDCSMLPLWDYEQLGENGEKINNGRAYLAVVNALGELPESEMSKIGLFDTVPDPYTYDAAEEKADLEKIERMWTAYQRADHSFSGWKSSHTYDDKSVIRNIILVSQQLDQRRSGRIEEIVSDLCGLQYDPNPTIHLNHYMMLWNRKKDFTVEELDAAAYQEFKITECYAFKRNMFFVPTNEFAIYRAALKDVVRWGSSDESYLSAANSPEDLAVEAELKKGLKDQPGMTTAQIWECLHLSDEWDAYVKARRAGDLSHELPIFRAFYRLKRKTDLVTCGRNPGTFKEPLYILKENIGINEWPNSGIDKNEAKAYLIEKLIASFGVSYPVHISHITGIPTAEVTPFFSKLEREGKLSPIKIGKRSCYIHSSRIDLLENRADLDEEEVRLISPMDILVRDQTWLKTFFDYSYTFEYFKKKGMKWPLSILVGNRFVGYFDCKMEWRTGRFLIKEKNIFDFTYRDHKGIKRALQELAAFHGARDIVEI